jgi:ribosomal protein L6P/L9E
MLFRNIYLPVIFNFLCLKTKNEKTVHVFVYNNIMFLKLKINTKNLFLHKETNNIKLLFDECDNNSIFMNNTINKFLKELHMYHYIKIKFKGKGYKIKILRKRKMIQFFFGVSHIKVTFLKKIILKKLTKYKFLLKSKNIHILKRISNKILNVRKINPYTLRGLRLSKAVVIKRKGKKGVWI